MGQMQRQLACVKHSSYDKPLTHHVGDLYEANGANAVLPREFLTLEQKAATPHPFSLFNTDFDGFARGLLHILEVDRLAGTQRLHVGCGVLSDPCTCRGIGESLCHCYT